MMEQQLLILLGDTTALDETTLKAAISFASQHYLRYRPYITNWGDNPRAYSWIMEYALAYCKLLIGDLRLTSGTSNGIGGQELINVATTAMTALDAELNTFA